MLIKYLKSEFARNVIVLTSMTGISQLIPLLVLPFLQKFFYTAHDFGILSLYVSISLMFVKVSTGSYEFAIVKQESENSALNIFVGTVLILFVVTFLIFIGICLMYFFLKSNFYIQTLDRYVFFIPLTVFTFGFYQILRYWYNREKQFTSIGISMLYKSFSAESSKLVLGLIKFSNVGLILGRVIGESVSFFYLLILFAKKNYQKIKKVNKKEISNLLKANYQFPMFTMPSGLKGTLLNVVFVGLFAKYFGIAKAGILGISVSYISAAYGIISQSFSQVFFKRINELNGVSLYNTLKKNVLILSFMSVIILTLVLLIPNSLVIEFIGKKWDELMPVLKILIFSISISFVSSSVSFIYIRTNRQKEMLFFDFFHLSLVTISIIAGNYLTSDFIKTLKFYVAAQMLYYSLAIFLSFYFVKKNI